MVVADGIREVLGALERDFHDPQAVLTGLVQLLGHLSAVSPSSPTIKLINQRLSPSVQLLHHLLEQYISTEHEVAWHLCQLVAVWCRLAPRFSWEACCLRLWRLLQRSRKLYPESPRMLESSLDATIAMLESTELHQLLASRETNDCERVADELLQLLDIFDSPPARTTLLSPHYDFSTIVILALQALNALFSSARVATRLLEHQSYPDQVLRRLVPVLPHFLKAQNPTRVWLAMARSQLKFAPQLALARLFLDTTMAASWCQQLVSRWSEDRGVVHDFSALFSQIFAVPHGAGDLAPDVASALVHKHTLLDLMTALFKSYTTSVASADALSAEHERMRPVVYEIARVLRQLAGVPSIASLLPSTSVVKTVLIPHLISECLAHIQDITHHHDSLLLQWRLRLVLELFLTTESCSRIPALARLLPSSQLRSALTRLEKQLVSMNTEDDAALPAVLLRQAQSLRTLLPSSSSPCPSKRLPSSSRTVSRLRSATSSSSSLVVRRSPSSSTVHPA